MVALAPSPAHSLPPLPALCRRGNPPAIENYEVLNEVVISRGANPFLTKIEVYEHDTLITKVGGSPQLWRLRSDCAGGLT